MIESSTLRSLVIDFQIAWSFEFKTRHLVDFWPCGHGFLDFSKIRRLKNAHFWPTRHRFCDKKSFLRRILSVDDKFVVKSTIFTSKIVDRKGQFVDLSSTIPCGKGFCQRLVDSFRRKNHRKPFTARAWLPACRVCLRGFARRVSRVKWRLNVVS